MKDGMDRRNEDGARVPEGAAGFDASLAVAMKELVGDDAPKTAFYEDFDASLPPAAELLDTFEEAAGEKGDEDRLHARRTRRYRWAAYSSLAAAVAIVLLVTTVYSPGTFTGRGVAQDAQGGAPAAASSADESAAEEAGAAGAGPADVLLSEVAPAAPPAPQADYGDIYDAMAGMEGFRLDEAIAYAKENGAEALYGDMVRDMGSVGAADSVASEEATIDGAPSAEEAAPAAEAPAAEVPAAEAPAAEAPVAEAPAEDAAAPAPEFSDTNIQTAGVQEADIVKTDGRYLYTVNDRSVCISEARDGHPELLSEIPQVTDDGQVYFEMYINGDTLTLVRQGYSNLKDKDGRKLRPAEDGGIDYPGERYMIDTSVDIYDVSDRRDPRKLRSLSQSGRYTDSRMIGDKLYLISTYGEFDYAAMDRDDPRSYTPLFAEGASQITAEPGEISLPEQPEFMSYTVVSGVDTASAKFVSHESLFGESCTVYASQDNLYLSAYKYGEEEKRIQDFTVRIGGDRTRVTRLSLKDGKVKVEASADVPGTVDDRYSLDEYEGVLRVVTTRYENIYAESDAYRERYAPEPMDIETPGDASYSEQYYDNDNGGESAAPGSSSSSDDIDGTIREIERSYGELEWRGYDNGYREERSTGLYVLDMDLRTLGKVEDLAPGEQVYSCRYMGDVAYFVTFRNTDPLFSVDLSDRARPKVMGKLKIPGFSEYLHPYADGLLFGLGSDADEETGEVRSLKVSMFDNSDPYDVSERDKLILDGLYSSYAANNPKAVLVDARKSLLAFPADGSYIILGYEKGEGFRRVMDVALDPAGYDDMWRWYGGLRGLFIGDVFYVIAPDSIHSYDMTKGFEAMDSVSLGSGAGYVDRDSFSLPPGYRYEDVYIDIPVEAYVE